MRRGERENKEDTIVIISVSSVAGLTAETEIFTTEDNLVLPLNPSEVLRRVVGDAESIRLLGIEAIRVSQTINGTVIGGGIPSWRTGGTGAVSDKVVGTICTEEESHGGFVRDIVRKGDGVTSLEASFRSQTRGVRESSIDTGNTAWVLFDVTGSCVEVVIAWNKWTDWSELRECIPKTLRYPAPSFNHMMSIWQPSCFRVRMRTKKCNNKTRKKKSSKYKMNGYAQTTNTNIVGEEAGLGRWSFREEIVEIIRKASRDDFFAQVAPFREFCKWVASKYGGKEWRTLRGLDTYVEVDSIRHFSFHYSIRIQPCPCCDKCFGRHESKLGERKAERSKRGALKWSCCVLFGREASDPIGGHKDETAQSLQSCILKLSCGGMQINLKISGMHFSEIDTEKGATNAWYSEIQKSPKSHRCLFASAKNLVRFLRDCIFTDPDTPKKPFFGEQKSSSWIFVAWDIIFLFVSSFPFLT